MHKAVDYARAAILAFPELLNIVEGRSVELPRLA